MLGKEKLDDRSSAESNCVNVAGKLCLFSSPSNWIIDSGATDHMCHDMSFFADYKVISNSENYITIPNGKQVSITQIGNVIHKNNIVLQDVLYVPEFKFNLISIPKLCKYLNSVVTFTDSNYFIQKSQNL